MADIDPTLAAIIRSATTAADLAAVECGGRSISEFVKAGVHAAITTAVRNGVLAVTPDAHQILTTTGYRARFDDKEAPNG